MKTWTINVVATGPTGPGEMVTHEGDESRSERFEAPGARSATEVVLEGYSLALGRVIDAGVVLCTLRDPDAVLSGYLRRNWRVGRPWIMARWRQVSAKVDELRGLGVLVEL